MSGQKGKKLGMRRRIRHTANAVFSVVVSVILAMWGVVPAGAAPVAGDETAQTYASQEQNTQENAQNTSGEATVTAEMLGVDSTQDVYSQDNAANAMTVPGQEAASAGTDTSSAYDEAATDAAATDEETVEKKKVEQKIITAENREFIIELTYGEEAGIPDGAQLSVIEMNQIPSDPKWKEDPAYKDRPLKTERFMSEAAMKERAEAITTNLKLQDEDYLFYKKYMNISIKSGDKTITPAAPVEISIKTNDIDVTESEALTVARYEGRDKETDKMIYVELPTFNESTKQDGTKFSFETDKMGELAIAGIASPLFKWQVGESEVTLLGAWSLEAWVEDAWAAELPEGYELADSVFATGALRPEALEGREIIPDYDQAMWVKAAKLPMEEPAETAEPAPLSIYQLNEYGEPAALLFNESEGANPAKIIWGTPFAAVYETTPAEEPSEPATEPGDDKPAQGTDDQNPEGEQAPVGEDQGGATGSDESLPGEDEGTSQSPEEGTDGEDAAGVKAVQETAGTIDSLSSDLSDVLASIKKTATLEASDGNTYTITVDYGPEAMIPDDATLQVRELTGSELATYKNFASKVVKGEAGDYTRAFDISLVGPNGIEYEPRVPVEVRIELSDMPGKDKGDVQVVHFDGIIPQVMTSTATKNSVDFSTDGFSVYLVLTTEAGEGEEDPAIIDKQMTLLDGNWAYWQIDINAQGAQLNGGQSLTLTDTFTEGQSIDYASIQVTDGNVSYDYRGQTGTYVIPDETPVTISYRTRIAAQPGQTVAFGNTATLSDSNTVIGSITTDEYRVIYPSASDVATISGNYMVKAYVYANGQMQTGIPGAQFILLDAEHKPMTYKTGENAGNPITFTTGDNGYVDIHLSAEECGVAIQKNTAYYLEMIKAPEGYAKDNTLYSFMITDDPGYASGDVWTYYNGDTMKMRLYPEGPSLNVSMRFSGNYQLTQAQKNDIDIILQKKDGDSWAKVEEHPFSDFSNDSLTFTAGNSLEVGSTYRVIQENEKPYDLDSDVNLTTTHYLIVGSNDSIQGAEPQEFTVTDDNAGSSFNVVINNEYEKHELTITKMDKQTGEKLSGAVFTVSEVGAEAGTPVATYTTGADGVAIIIGGDNYDMFELYRVEETTPPAGYLLPVVPEYYYFYFCNDPDLEPGILANLPEGATAVNLSETYANWVVDNQKEQLTIPVMATWQGNEWPSDVQEVTIGLYKSVNGSDPEPVRDDGGPLQVGLRSIKPYDNTTFQNLPARDGDNPITYSIVEEAITSTGNASILNDYVKEYGISDSGVYIVRNSKATTLAVSKEWYDLSGTKVEDPATLSQQSDVTFDVYQTIDPISDAIKADGISNEEMEQFVSENNLKPVRTNIKFGSSDSWSATISDLVQKDNFGNTYYYYPLETVPSFGDETYVVNEDDGTVTIKNKVAPATVSVTVEKAQLVNDPRTESVNTDFEFTLALNKGTHPIREYQVYANGADTLVTDWNGEVTFTLKPEEHITLTLPVGVTATVTEGINPEYMEEASAQGLETLNTDEARICKFTVDENSGGGKVTYTNTLRVICKVKDDNGEEHPFESLKSALKYVREHPNDFSSNPVTIEMLEDYNMPQSDVFDVRSDENITLTTATTDQSAQFPFKTTRSENTDTAIITRAGINENGSMLTNAGTLNLDKVTLDGAKDTYTVTGNGGIVNNTGTLNLTENTTLRNSAASGMGGAIYSAGMVNMPGGSITGNVATSGSAIYLNNCVLNMSGGSIESNTSTEDGAVVPSSDVSKVNLSGNTVIFGNTNGDGEWANVFLDVDSDYVINVSGLGLGSDAQIGVRAMQGHREIGERFATVVNVEEADLSTLNCFVNDLYEYHGKLKEGTTEDVVWDGLTLKLNKVFGGQGAIASDTFTITLTSSSIRKSNYTIDGNNDYTITAARVNTPGTIVLRGVKASDEITISPLPAGNYTITEAESNYSPTYYGHDDDTDAGFDVPNGTFALQGDSTIDMTNVRRLATVNLTKSLEDKLKTAGESQEFSFTAKLIEADGTTPVTGFELAEGITTNNNGEATFTMTPNNGTQEGDKAKRSFVAPVGATMTITETENSDYRVTTDATCEDSDPAANIFAFLVTDDGANISFANVRKMAGIELRKNLVNKVSATESFTFEVTLSRADGQPAANYTMYTDAEDPTKNITTDARGKATIPFIFGSNESTKDVNLTIPDGTKLVVTETDANGHADWYDTTYSRNGGAATAGNSVTINRVSDADNSIAFTNTRKTRTITVTNTVGGYSGNIAPFAFTATVTDGAEGQDDYDANGFTNGVQTFELSTGQSKTLTVPYGARLNITEDFIVGYETTIVHTENQSSTTKPNTNTDEFTVENSATVAFTNNQLISLVLVNNTSSDMENVQVYTSYGTKMYRVNETNDGQDPVDTFNSSTHWATVSIDAGKTAILEVNHQSSVTAEQNYTVKGNGPAAGYYYTVKNEPSFHEFADPAFLRIYDTAQFEVKGKLRYSVSDSTITFSEQPLVSFDANGGAWTTEMEGYRDRDGDRQVYQYAVTSGETVEKPFPDPVYPTDEGIVFLGWTQDADVAHASHAASDTIQEFDFANTAITEPITLYSVWSRPARDKRVVTVENAIAQDLTITATLSNTSPSDGVTLADGVVTDSGGQATFTLLGGTSKNLTVPDGAKLVLTASGSSCIEYSSVYTDADGTAQSFTIDQVNRDGTVSFIAGICKITDSNGNILYDINGKPAVYGTLADGFTAYNGTLYTDASHATVATQAAVKMLIDEYAISSKHAFPTKNVTVTTASKTDTDFPYMGVRDQATLYRPASFASDCLFTLESTAREVTLTDIILDGRNVSVAKTINGGLIYVNQTNAVLNITTGTTLRNVVFVAPSSSEGKDKCLGGAIYIPNGTLNVSAGLFSNLHAQYGGAIATKAGNATINISGTNGSTRFENCTTDSNNQNDDRGDGGAIYLSSSSGAISIDGGNDKANPGVIFTGCRAGGPGGDGGAVRADTWNTKGVSISGCSFVECSARNTTGGSTDGTGGGAISGHNVTSLQVSQCTFESCDSMVSGGAINAYVKTNNDINNKTVQITECSFNNCNCKAQGGGVAAYQDNNGATSSRTELGIVNCEFTNCSSGTNQGSGGAIQSYLPCVDFIKSNFTDCWAGKEGGAFNNWYGGDSAVWPNSYLNVNDCEFIRCRAEDRFDLTNRVHYGGAIATKAETLTIADSYFEACVSTLREGGAVHCSGFGDNSLATVSNTTFIDCQAKTNGGAFMASSKNLTIKDSKFYGCGSFGGDGGAIYHGQSVNNVKSGSSAKIENCSFIADPEGGASAASCSAANNGGAIWTKAMSVEIENCAINACIASGNGGGVYIDNSLGYTSKTIIDGFITNCQAAKGSAVYVNGTTVFSGVNINQNTCSDINSGAIHGGTLHFEGDVKVENNSCSSDSTYKHDVLMQNNNVTTIYTTSNGLGDNASIGVYVPDSQFNNRGTEGKAFGTWKKDNDALDCFFNDRNAELFGYQSSETDTNIYWGMYVCKITDADGNTLLRPNGRDAVYQRLTMALDDFIRVKDANNETGKAVYIKMLDETYDIKQTNQVSNFPVADITLTSAGTNDEKYPYRGTPGTVCTVSRSNNTNQLFYLNTTGATFQLKDIILDGRRDKTTETGSFRLIQADKGTVIVNGGTILQYGSAGGNSGGAISISNGNANLRIDSTEGKDVLFDHCVTTSGSGGGGGAIYSTGILEITSDGKGKTIFTDCYGARGGAIYMNAAVGATIDRAEFTNCSARYEGGAINHTNTTNSGTAFLTVTNSSFTGCYTVESDQYSHGGAIGLKAGKLTVDACQFTDCYAFTNGGAINHGAGQTDRLNTTITNTIFTRCHTTATNMSYGYGGSVYTQAREVVITDCSFEDSTATNYGGGLYCQRNSGTHSTTISGTDFSNCTVSRNDGYGGAIYCQSNTLTLKDSAKGNTSISNCSAKGYSGAVYMDTNNSTLNISDNTLISGCYANRGGAIYLKNTVTMNISGSPEFTKNGYTTSGQNAAAGACIFLVEGSRINLSGSPKFSRNNITNQRVVNGGIYDYVRQDLYLAGYNGTTYATSIYVTGELTGDTIWVWPESSPHRLPGEQFAKIAGSGTISNSSLYKFRNALADGNGGTGCNNGEYLSGVRHDGDTTNIYWDKMYVVSFLKVDNKAVSVPDAEFTLYTDSACTNGFATATSADGEHDVDANGDLLARGTVYFTSVPIGVYYMKETRVPVSFKPNDTVYLVLVGSTNLTPNDYNTDLWHNGGPLDVPNAPNLVARYTINAGKYYGVYPLDAGFKADVSKNLASANVGVVNIRSDYEAWFMKTDSSYAALPNAAFTIYYQVKDEHGDGMVYDGSNYPVLKLWSRTGEEDDAPDPVKSADGTNKYKKLDGTTVPKGVVYFRELPIGTYYLLETSYPDRNGSNRKTFYVESDRVFKLEIMGDTGFTLSEWQEDGSYTLVEQRSGYYTVTNMEAACKLTDGNNNLLYKLGHDGQTLIPALYPSLEDGFAAAQANTLHNSSGNVVADADNNPALKLQALRDLTLSSHVEYTSPRALTLTTASRTATAADRYVFTTTRTSDTSRAEIKRAYSESSPDGGGALITLANNAAMTLQNINLNGQKGTYTGRAIEVGAGSSLTMLNNTLVQKFQAVAQAGSEGADNVAGGAVLLDDGASLRIDGGSSRTAEFSNNAVINNRDSGATGAEGGALAIGTGCNVELKNVRFTGNSASSAAGDGNGGAMSFIGAHDDPLTIENGVFTSNTASHDGGAIQTVAGLDLTLKNNVFKTNKANSPSSSTNPGSGGAVNVVSSEVNPSSLTVNGGSFEGNSATGSNGGAINVGEYGSFTLASNGTLSGNSAAHGSAVFVADHAAATIAGTITANKASAGDGGAINVGGPDARLYFEGSPVVFDNTNASGSQQRNVVLGHDSNGIINTTANGLTGGAIGIYVTDGELGRHGVPNAPFGTFGDAGRANAQAFINDRTLSLYGVANAGDENDNTIYWLDAICKLTAANDGLLYKDVKISVGNRTWNLKAPAIYTTVQDGFDATKGKLYLSNGSSFNADNLKLKMLKDVELGQTITYSTSNRKVTYTTAETQVSQAMSAIGDIFTFATTRTDGSGNASTKALISRGFDGDSMIAANGMELTLADITLDGGVGNGRSATADGGIVRVASGKGLVVADGALLQNSSSAGNGGAVYVSNGARATVSGGAIVGNTAAGNGGAIFAASGSTSSVSGGTISGNTAALGAGIYVSEGARLSISGAPSFGGTDTDEDGNILGLYGNFVPGELTDQFNGVKAYARARQDIYLAENKGETPESLVVSGNLTGAPGSIWVWAANEPEFKQAKPFARFADGMSSNGYAVDQLKVFRNARNDVDSENGTTDYLYGDVGENAIYVYWTSLKGERKIVLKKVAADGTPLSGAGFELYASNGQTRIDWPEGSTENNERQIARSDATGVFFVGVLPVGEYYLREVETPSGYGSYANTFFHLTVALDGATIEAPTP